LIKMIILEENFKWHLEAFASELFIYMLKIIIIIIIIKDFHNLKRLFYISEMD